ncbi:MAG: bacterial transcriptional activator domain-containing protein [Candidatus Glassbacteria bacterium]
MVGLLGAARHYLTDKKSFYFWLTVFLITGPVLNTYMNFKLGYEQFLDAYPDSGMHEVRERDYFFIISFAFYGVWSGLGLAAIVDWFRRTFKADSPQALMGRPVFAAISVPILLLAFVPVFTNRADSDRSGNYIPSNYARNIMNSMDPGGIIFTNGDNDTFPLWYIQEVEGVRKDCRVINLSLLNTNWYIKQMRDLEPKVPVSYSDEQIDQMMPIRLPREQNVRLGEIALTFPVNSVLYVKDIILLDILRNNRWQRPIYFTTTVPTDNRTLLSPYLTMEGAVYRINPRKAADIAKEDSNFVEVPGVPDIYIDIRRTADLLYKTYTYETFFRKTSGGEEANMRLSSHFAAPFAWLGHAYQVRGQFEKAIEANLWARKFFEDPHQWDFAVASLYAINRQYSQAREMVDSFIQFTKTPGAQSLYRQIAQEALRHGDNFEAANLVERGLELDPEDRSSYAALFMIYNSAGNREMAARSVQRYLTLHPQDSLISAELQQYLAGGNFDVNKAFGPGR